MARIPPHRRPLYPPTERLAILEVKAARQWSLEQTARAFLVTSVTIASWLARVAEPTQHPFTAETIIGSFGDVLGTGYWSSAQAEAVTLSLIFASMSFFSPAFAFGGSRSRTVRAIVSVAFAATAWLPETSS